MTVWARRTISSPSGVTLTSLPPRSESFTSSSSSSFLIAALSVGWETKQASAARPKCFSHATATMYSAGEGHHRRLPLANERVQCKAAGQVVLKLKTPWRDGTTHLMMSPLELMKLPIQRLLCGSQVRRCYVSSGSRLDSRSAELVARNLSSNCRRRSRPVAVTGIRPLSGSVE
jgi:hypothetical protein